MIRINNLCLSSVLYIIHVYVDHHIELGVVLYVCATHTLLFRSISTLIGHRRRRVVKMTPVETSPDSGTLFEDADWLNCVSHIYISN